MLSKCFSFRCSTQRFFVAAIAASIVLFNTGVSNISAAQSSRNSFTVDLEIPNQLRYTRAIQQAELLARSEITKQFSLNPSLNEVQVVVLGHYVGDIVPLLTVNVSREQWQSSPQVDRWGSYYSATYALLSRHDEDDSANDNRIARSSGSARGVNPSQSQEFVDEAEARIQVEAAFRDGLLTRDVYQQSIDALD